MDKKVKNEYKKALKDVVDKELATIKSTMRQLEYLEKTYNISEIHTHPIWEYLSERKQSVVLTHMRLIRQVDTAGKKK